MKITINKKDYKIKPASEMTVSEYSNFFGSISEKPGQMEIIICYISAITGLEYQQITSVNIDENSLRRIMAYIGTIETPATIKTIDTFYYKKTGKKYYQKNINWRTLGVRKLMEDRKEENQLNLACYQLAVYISGNYDNEKIEQIYSELQSYNSISVYGFILFFFKNLMSGEKSEQSYLKRLMKKVSINIRTLFNR